MDAPAHGELGKYRLIAEIARGGMGIVYLALMGGAGGFYRTLVIKELKPEYAHDRAFLAMFLDEARIAAKLHHPNIVQVFEVDQVSGRYFLAMEYLEGVTMRRAMKSLRGDFSIGMVLASLSEILLGLHHAHELTDEAGVSLGLVHRDMSPHNIFLTFDGQAKTIDFGIVKTTETQHTEVGVFKGKVAYMPPEQASPDMVVDRRADIYAVGVILFEALTGRRLWAGMQEVHILASLLQGGIPTIDKVKPSVPAELRRICNKAMAWDREQRYATAEEFREDIERYFTDTGLSVNMRDVGGLLARSFESERAKMKGLVDSKIAQLKAGGDEQRLSIAPPPVRLSIEAPAPDQSGSISGFYEEKALEDKPKLLALVDDEQPSELTFRKARLRDFAPQLVALAAIVLTSILFLVFFVPGQGMPDPSRGPIAAATTARPSSTGPSPAPQMIDIEIRVTPPTATVVIDDVLLTGNPPYSVHYKKGIGSHVAKAMADGYIAKEQEFGVDRDMLLDLSLARIPPPPVTVRVGSRREPPHPTTNVTSPPPPQTATPQPTRPQPTSTVRPIETSSPYGN